MQDQTQETTVFEQLSSLAKEVQANNAAKGFWDGERNRGELLMLMVSELGEGMEALRKNRHCPAEILQEGIDELNHGLEGDFAAYFHSNIKDTHEDELADALIRILDYCGGHGIDIGQHVRLKLEFNKSRARLHGKLF